MLEYHTQLYDVNCITHEMFLSLYGGSKHRDTFVSTSTTR